MVYINFKCSIDKQYLEEQPIHRLKIRTHRNQITIMHLTMSCKFTAATNPGVTNEMGTKCNEAYIFLGKERNETGIMS